MKRIWTIVLIAALALFVLGAILTGAGFLTGASTERVWSVLSDQLRAMETALRQYHL